MSSGEKRLFERRRAKQNTHDIRQKFMQEKIFVKIITRREQIYADGVLNELRL